MELDGPQRTDAVSQLSSGLRRFMDFECRHLHKVHALRNPTVQDLDEQYLPERATVFELPCYWIRRQLLYVNGRLPPSDDSLLATIARDDHVLYPIHPAELPRYAGFLARSKARNAKEEGLRIWATPSSSTRTLLAWPDGEPRKALFVKTSIHAKTFGDRRISRARAAASVGLSWLVRDSATHLPQQLGYFFENMSFVVREFPEHGGVIFRNIPAEILSGRTVPLPLFALMGGPGDRRPLLLEITERSGLSLTQFLEEVLFERFAQVWVSMCLDSGYLIEAHGQDLMLGVTPELALRDRFYYRDFEGLAVDWPLRWNKGYDSVGLPHAYEWFRTYDTWGYPYFQLAWCKWHTSLYGYLHFVLNELDVCIRSLQKRGLVARNAIDGEPLTRKFARHLNREIQGFVGVDLKIDYDIYPSLNRCVLALMRLRRMLMEARNAEEHPH